MSTVIDSTAIRTKPLSWIALAFVVALVLAAVGKPNLMRARMAENDSSRVAQKRALETRLASNMYDSRAAKARPLAMIASDASMKASKEEEAGAIVPGERKMVRTGSIDLIVQKPAEAAERIRALAEGMGGFLVSSEVSGAPFKGTASLTIRVPAASFEEARAEIRKLGLRVESEKVEAQDVTRQYVDQDANLRNLRAEEAQYLSILKQAHTVKDTLAVSEKLGEVRGQIEQQQAEFDTLSKQIETVAITIALRAEAEAEVFGLQWRPLYQMKLALRDGLDALADYAGSMTSIVFYLPAALLWVATIVVGAVVGWRILRWVARVFVAWPRQAAVQKG
jgi:Domain of unknown function (DUF4349)